MADEPTTKPREHARERGGADEPKLREPAEKEQKPGGAVRQDSNVLGDVSPRDETTR